ncbi:MAG: hypothetical protein AB7E79_07770 [Rhodospirillaceae bacterium]
MAGGNFFSELKRRNVYRVGAAYAVAAFVLLEVVSNAAPFLDLPLWVGRMLILLLLVGLPAVLCFAWIYEFTPDGLKRTAEVEKDASVTHQTGRRLNFVTIGLLAILAGLYAADLFLLPAETAVGAARTPAASSPKAPAPEGISIAVLPFVNLSSDPEQEFFSDGMTEEITSALAKIQSLRVVGRTSAFKFKGQNEDLRTIGKALSASHVLEGSVRKSGSRVRITAQLIRADDGTHLWTENYDRELTDIFAIQDEISRAIAGAMHAPLGLRAGELLVASRGIDPESYQLYLRAKALFRARGNMQKPLTAAAALLDQVVAANPDYAPGWALKAQVYANLPQESFPQLRTAEERRKVVEPALDTAEAAARRALELASNSADSYAAAANVQVFRGNRSLMEDLYRQALKIDPFNPEALHGLSQQLHGVGRQKEAFPLRQQLQALEPLVPRYNIYTGHVYFGAGRFSEALALYEGLPAGFEGRDSRIAATYAALGRYEEAATAILNAPRGVFPASDAEAAVRLLRLAPTPVARDQLPEIKGPLAFVYVFVGAAELAGEYALDVQELTMRSRYGSLGGGSVVFTLQSSPYYQAIRKTDRYKKLARDAGYLDYWRARGWPDNCRPAGADDFECD